MLKKKFESKKKPTALQQRTVNSACDEAREVLAGAERGSTLANYRVAQIALDLSNEAKFGDGALKTLGTTIELSHKRLYCYMGVAETWPAAKFKDLAAMRNKRGRSLKWSHFEALADVKDPKKRDELLTHTVRENWTVRTLKRAISPQETARSAGRSAGRSPVPTLVEPTVATAGHLAQTLSAAAREAAAWDAAAVAKLAESPGPWVDEDRADVEAALRGVDDLSSVLADLRERLKSLAATMSVEPSPNEPLAAYEDADVDLGDRPDSDDADDGDQVAMAASPPA